MTEKINKTGEVFTDDKGKKWIPVLLSLDVIATLNRMVLGEHGDDDEKEELELRKQIHKDCLELEEEFHPD